MQRTVLRVTPLAEQGIAPLVPPLIDAFCVQIVELCPGFPCAFSPRTLEK